MNVSLIKKYFSENKPLGNNVALRKINFLGGGNHFNYKLSTSRGNFVLRINNPNGLGAGILFDISDEFTLLKLIENNGVSPKAFYVDLESPLGPLLVEEYIEGVSYSRLKKLDDNKIDAVVRMMRKISNIKLNQTKFPFRFAYSSYRTNIQSWNRRLNEIRLMSKEPKKAKQFLKEAKSLTIKAANILLRHEQMLRNTKPEFIYNDAHSGNIFWIPDKKKALFLDWQKVSLGDPSFMLAVFALAIENRVPQPREEFFDKLLFKYAQGKFPKNFKELFWLRVLEREVSNMIWVVWAAIKQNKKIPYLQLDKYERFVRTKKIIDEFEIKENLMKLHIAGQRSSRE